MRRRRVALGLALVLLGAAGCGGDEAAPTTLAGAGSSLVDPLVAQWASAYRDRAKTEVTYNPAGSGAGIQAITLREVDFGASDAPLTAAQAAAAHNVLQIPWALSATLLSYHLNGIPARLKLSGPVIASIFLGRITEWDDPAIARLNPGVQLPSQAITPIFRLDSSGDTYALTDYLSKVSPQWKKKVGASTQVDFPVGTGARGNAGIAGAITRTDGGIGYLAIPYVAAHGLESAAIENAAGRFPAPGIPSISAAAQTLRSLPPGNTVSITDPPASAPGAYPISTFTYALVPEQSAEAAALKPFLTYAIGDGQALGARYQFAPLPPIVRAADRETIARIHP